MYEFILTLYHIAELNFFLKKVNPTKQNTSIKYEALLYDLRENLDEKYFSFNEDYYRESKGV